MPTLDDYYRNKFQYGLEDYNTAGPEGDTQAVSYNVGYIPELLDLRQKVESGQGSEWDREWYAMQEQAARAIPMRDPGRLQYNAGDDAPGRLSGGSPDLANLMLTLQDRMRQGTASPEESDLFKTAYTLLADQNWRASVPQESDANPFGIGDNLIGALGTLALGATGGLAGGALAAGGGLASTLGSLGTLSGIAGTGAGVLGQATDQEWLQRLGLGLGAAGGIAGGIGGLANLASSGINSLGDAARLASNAGRVVGGAGAIADSDVLRQAGGWLGTAGQLGGGVENLMNLVGGQGGSLQGVMGLARPLQRIAGQFMQPGERPAPSVSRPVSAQQSAPQRPVSRAPAVQAGPVQAGGGSGGILPLLEAAREAQRRGMAGQVPQTMSGMDWLSMRGQRPPPQAVLWNLLRR